MNKIILSLLPLALILVGCSISEMNDSVMRPDPEVPVFHAGFEPAEMQDSETRTFFDENLRLYWTEDDRLTIFTSTLNEQYKFDGETGDNSGTFTKVSSGQFGSGSSISTNYAVYPYNSSTKISYSGEITVTLPEVQEYAEGTFGLGANTMVAVTDGKEDYFLPFKNVGGYLVLKLYGSGTVKSVTLTGNNGEKIAGTGVVSIEYGKAPTVEMSENGTESITIDCGEGVALGATASEATAFWFVVPPVTFEKGFTITAENTEGWTMTKSTSKERTITRNVKNAITSEAIFDTKEGYVYIPDVNFKAYLIGKGYDTDGDGEISIEEAEAIEYIYISHLQISDLSGIECFPNLTDLTCIYCQLTSLDVSANTALESLSCSGNQLKDLDLSHNTYLTQLDCSSNQLTDLDVSHNSYLTQLYCGSNQLTTLDLSHNPNIVSLDYRWTQLKIIGISSLNLEYLSCRACNLTEIDVTTFTNLRRLDCNDNQLTNLDVSHNTNLTQLDCGNNQLTTLDVSKNLALKELLCFDSQIESLDLSNNINLIMLYCWGNNLATLDLSTNTNLQSLYCSDNCLTNLTLPNSSVLHYVNCTSNQLTSLNVSENENLTTLKCGDNPLATFYINENQESQLSGWIIPDDTDVIVVSKE